MSEIQKRLDNITRLSGLKLVLVRHESSYKLLLTGLKNRPDIPVFYGSIEKIDAQLQNVEESLEYWKDVSF